MAVEVHPGDAPPVGGSNRERVSWEFAWLNRHDVAPLVEHMWTAETEVRFPDRTTRGPEQTTEYLNGMFAGLQGWHMDVLALAGEGEHVFVRWRLTGRHVGVVFGVAPTGSRSRSMGSIISSCAMTARSRGCSWAPTGSCSPARSG